MSMGVVKIRTTLNKRRELVSRAALTKTKSTHCEPGKQIPLEGETPSAPCAGNWLKNQTPRAKILSVLGCISKLMSPKGRNRDIKHKFLVK